MSALQKRDWKALVSKSFRELEALLEYCEIDPRQTGLKAIGVGVKTPEGYFPVREIANGVFTPTPVLRVTKYFASLIEKGNVLDPLLLQVLPDAQELQIVAGYSKDAVGDRLCMPIPGLIHKYHGRVLLTLTGACAIHCRYCFRRHFPYNESDTDYGASGQVMKYLSQKTQVTEVILSGGDPLMLNDQKLAALISGLNRIPHIRVLRIHSRLLSVLPERINETFLEVLRQFNGQIVFVTHINHPNEISGPNQAVFNLLSQQGYRLFNQSVLLRRVNDNVRTLEELSHKLFASQINPYYLHRLDKVQGAAHFDVPHDDACRLYTQLRKRLPGYLLPAMVEEISGQASKTPVHCN